MGSAWSSSSAAANSRQNNPQQNSNASSTVQESESAPLTSLGRRRRSSSALTESAVHLPSRRLSSGNDARNLRSRRRRRLYSADSASHEIMDEGAVVSSQQETTAWWRPNSRPAEEAPVPSVSADADTTPVEPAATNEDENTQNSGDSLHAGATFANTQHGHRVLRQALETVLLNLIHEQRLLRQQLASSENEQDRNDPLLRVDSFYFYGRFLADWTQRPAADAQSLAESSTDEDESASSTIMDESQDSQAQGDRDPEHEHHMTLIDLDAFQEQRAAAEQQTVIRRQWLNSNTFSVEMMHNQPEESEENRNNVVAIPLMIIGTHEGATGVSQQSSTETSTSTRTTTASASSVHENSMQHPENVENQPPLTNIVQEPSSTPVDSSQINGHVRSEETLQENNSAESSENQDDILGEQTSGQGQNSSGWIMYVVGGPSTGNALSRLQTLMNQQQQQQNQDTPSLQLEPRINGLDGRLVLLTNRGQGPHPTPTSPDSQQTPAAHMSALLSALLVGVSDGDMRRQLGLNARESQAGSRVQIGRAGPDGPETPDDTHMDSYELFLRIAELIGPARVRSVPHSLVQEQLPAIKYPEYCKACPASLTACPICLAPFGCEDDLRLLKCQHGYHKDCIDAWLCQHVNSCPLCRTEAVTVPPPSQ